MVILSNGLTTRPDEGFLNVANNLVKRIKQADPGVTVVSYERQSELTDCFLNLNKFLLSPRLFSLVRRQEVLYIPFPAKTVATALRIFLLSRMTGRRLRTLLVMKGEYGALARLLLRWSGVQVIALSSEAATFYRGMLPAERVTCLRCGVDTERFTPVSPERCRELKRQYGFDPDRPVVLHVGHLNAGRGVGELLKLDEKYQILLVTSPLTAGEQDGGLRARLLERPSLRLVDSYIPAMEDVYRLCDVYFFPTAEQGRCIDVPLSCLEAAACGKPVVTTAYGEMAALWEQEGFYPITSFAADALNETVAQALACTADPRKAALDYDWDGAVSVLCEVSR